MSSAVVVQVAGGVCQAVHLAPATEDAVCVVDWDNIIEGDDFPDLFEGVTLGPAQDELLFDARWVLRW